MAIHTCKLVAKTTRPAVPMQHSPGRRSHGKAENKLNTFTDIFGNTFIKDLVLNFK